METISREFRVALPWELSYVDDFVVIAETEEDLMNGRIMWRIESNHHHRHTTTVLRPLFPDFMVPVSYTHLTLPTILRV